LKDYIYTFCEKILKATIREWQILQIMDLYK